MRLFAGDPLGILARGVSGWGVQWLGRARGLPKQLSMMFRFVFVWASCLSREGISTRNGGTILSGRTGRFLS